MKLLHDIMIYENNSMRVIPSGSILEGVFDLDEPQQQDTESDLLGTLQDWMQKNLEGMSPRMVKMIKNLLQPAVDAIHDGNVDKIKDLAQKLDNRAQELAGKKEKFIVDKVVDGYLAVLRKAKQMAMAESVVAACSEAEKLLAD